MKFLDNMIVKKLTLFLETFKLFITNLIYILSNASHHTRKDISIWNNLPKKTFILRCATIYSWLVMWMKLRTNIYRVQPMRCLEYTFSILLQTTKYVCRLKIRSKAQHVEHAFHWEGDGFESWSDNVSKLKTLIMIPTANMSDTRH